MAADGGDMDGHPTIFGHRRMRLTSFSLPAGQQVVIAGDEGAPQAVGGQDAGGEWPAASEVPLQHVVPPPPAGVPTVGPAGDGDGGASPLHLALGRLSQTRGVGGVGFGSRRLKVAEGLVLMSVENTPREGVASTNGMPLQSPFPIPEHTSEGSPLSSPMSPERGRGGFTVSTTMPSPSSSPCGSSVHSGNSAISLVQQASPIEEEPAGRRFGSRRVRVKTCNWLADPAVPDEPGPSPPDPAPPTTDGPSSPFTPHTHPTAPSGSPLSVDREPSSVFGQRARIMRLNSSAMRSVTPSMGGTNVTDDAMVTSECSTPLVQENSPLVPMSPTQTSGSQLTVSSSSGGRAGGGGRHTRASVRGAATARGRPEFGDLTLEDGCVVPSTPFTPYTPTTAGVMASPHLRSPTRGQVASPYTPSAPNSTGSPSSAKTFGTRRVKRRQDIESTRALDSAFNGVTPPDACGGGGVPAMTPAPPPPAIGGHPVRWVKNYRTAHAQQAVSAVGPAGNARIYVENA